MVILLLDNRTFEPLITLQINKCIAFNWQIVNNQLIHISWFNSSPTYKDSKDGGMRFEVLDSNLFKEVVTAFPFPWRHKRNYFLPSDMTSLHPNYVYEKFYNDYCIFFIRTINEFGGWDICVGNLPCCLLVFSVFLFYLWRDVDSDDTCLQIWV